MTEQTDIVRALFDAYADKDRAAIERLLAPDFRFTSPYDRGIDRDAYMRDCWPTSRKVRRHHLTDVCGSGETWLVRYRLELISGDVYTNVERFTVQGGLVRAVEVYFGDPIPVPRPDFAVSRKVAAPPEAVHRALTTPEGLGACWENAVSGDARPGGTLTFGFRDWGGPARMRVDVAGPDAVQWTVTADDGFGGEWVGTKPRFEIADDGAGGAVLDFRHIGLTPDLGGYARATEAWASFLDAVAAGAAGAPERSRGSSASEPVAPR